MLHQTPQLKEEIMLKAGCTTVDITPARGVKLGGYPHYPRHNTGVHDPLYAGIMYLDNGTEELMLITLDVLFFAKQNVAKARKAINKKTGIAADRIHISAIHTHSGPCAAYGIDVDEIEAGQEQPEEYIAEIVEKLAEGAAKAKAESFDAEFGSGIAICGAKEGVGGNRRIPGGPHDPYVSVMAVREQGGKVRGIYVNYTLHPTFIHEWSTVCTADYVGYVRKQLEELYDGADVAFSQGASGNQSSRYYRQGESFDEAERVGRLIGKAASEAVEKLEWKQDPVIKQASAELPVRLRDFGTEEDLEKQCARDRERYEYLYGKYGKSENREEYYLWQNANLKLLGSENQLGYVKIQNRGIEIKMCHTENPAELNAIRIGDACLLAAPGEIFVEYALYLKGMAPYKTVIFSELTNGCLPGYLYTPESLATGGYETDTSMLDKKFGREMVDAMLRLIDRISE